jgi:hypothetical protein
MRVMMVILMEMMMMMMIMVERGEECTATGEQREKRNRKWEPN